MCWRSRWVNYRPKIYEWLTPALSGRCRPSFRWPVELQTKETTPHVRVKKDADLARPEHTSSREKSNQLEMFLHICMNLDRCFISKLIYVLDNGQANMK